MDRANLFVQLLTVFALAVIAFAVMTKLGGPATILQPQQQPATPLYPEYEITTYRAHINLYEGIGPNEGSKIDGNVYIYKTPIDDPYKIPADALLETQVPVANGSVDVFIGIDETFQKDDGHIKLWFIGESAGHYKAVKEVQIPAKAPDYTYEGSVAIRLDKVAKMTWSADDAYRGTDSPILRYSASAELYKTVFVIKPTIDFNTDKPSGVFIVKRIDILAGDADEMSKIDTMSIAVGDAKLDVAASDLPETVRLDAPVKITTDAPLEVKAEVITTDGTASLTSGATIFNVKITDVLDNTYTVAVKAA